MDKKELTTAQMLSLDIYHVCVGHRLSDVHAALEMFSAELKKLAVVTDCGEPGTSEALCRN